MPSSTTISLGFATAILTACMLGSYALWEVQSPSKKRQRVRTKLPQNLDTWRVPGSSWEAEERVWVDLDQVFTEAGFTLWKNAFCCTLAAPSNAYPYQVDSVMPYPPERRIRMVAQEPSEGFIGSITRFNPLQRAARTRDGHDVIVRVIVIGNEGHEHLSILRRIATGRESLWSNNHTLSMLAEFQFEDITFGIFPKVGGSVQHAYGCWTKNSVGDNIEMLMQMLEALAFIHNLNIAHRVSAHRVSALLTLLNFEAEMYDRPHAPEFASGKPYNPFKLDVWQLGKSLKDFKSTVPGIDEILGCMVDPNPDCRINAKEALDGLRKVVHSSAPESFLIEPVLVGSLVLSINQ